MITFRTIKYKHRRQALEIAAQAEQVEAEEDPVQAQELEQAITDLAMAMVESWDLVDAETGEPIPPGEADELTMEQYDQVMTEFNRQMRERAEVPKTNASPSHSGSTRSKRARSGSRSRRTG